MAEVIKLLADHIANQIAAGEVVQRPASVVKELIENSIDSGADRIQLIAKDGGKTLVQVIDNGSGMSEMDARMCFERHATSKISSADDLFQLQTKGFRGEALASIAAIAHVSLKTRLHDAELGTEIINEGSQIVSQEACAFSAGTSIAVKNLFFNVPARRNFLGKNTTEYRKILDEFLRIALVHPEIQLSFHHDDNEIYNLPKQGLRQRIVQVFGNAYNQRLVPVNEETDLVKITGFVTKPEFAKASRDQQYLFVNDRYFKDRYFNHAIQNAYDGLVPSGKFPPYFLYFDVPTESIDVNVHPTKTEVKFEENQAIYAIIRSSVKQALGQFNIAPTLDFERETSFDPPKLKAGEAVRIPEIKVDPDYNPFHSTKPSTSSHSSGSTISSKGFSQMKPARADWENFYEGVKEQEDKTTQEFEQEMEEETGGEISGVTIPSSLNNEMDIERKKPVQISEKYIMTSVKNGFLLIDQYRAHCRILFESFMTEDGAKSNAQKLLFPENLEIDAVDLPWWAEAIPHLNELGFELKLEDKLITIDAVPADAKDSNAARLLQATFEQFKNSEQVEDLNLNEKLALSMASALAIKGGNKLSTAEMEFFVDALFACESPQLSPHGKKIIETFTMEEITQRFN
ncbi:MAG: DNA mismatch repair endonuclease MutL [Flavobacteriales bacterium]|nr:DNA mismatch repair endonuclease MutL [Flavobacteriales bacterium]